MQNLQSQPRGLFAILLNVYEVREVAELSTHGSYLGRFVADGFPGLRETVLRASQMHLYGLYSQLLRIAHRFLMGSEVTMALLTSQIHVRIKVSLQSGGRAFDIKLCKFILSNALRELAS